MRRAIKDPAVRRRRRRDQECHMNGSLERRIGCAKTWKAAARAKCTVCSLQIELHACSLALQSDPLPDSRCTSYTCKWTGPESTPLELAPSARRSISFSLHWRRDGREEGPEEGRVGKILNLSPIDRVGEARAPPVKVTKSEEVLSTGGLTNLFRRQSQVHVAWQNKSIN